MNIFEQASRSKLRVASEAGLLTVEQLWDLPLEGKSKVTLDKLAVAAHAKLQEQPKVSFVSEKTKEDTAAQLEFDILIHIIENRKATQDAAKKAMETKQSNARIRELIARKKDSELEGKSIEELEAMLK
jgi:hypothetical protein